MGEMTLKVFPQKNLSTKVLQAIVRVSKKAGSAQIECFITAPSLANEMRIAAEFALADPAVDNKINVDIHFPVAEFMAFVNAVVAEVQMIVGDLVQDGLLPDLTVLLAKLKLVILELPKYLVTLKAQLIELVTKYWPVVKDWVLKMWKELIEADIIAFLKNVPAELLRIWGILKTEVPVIVNDILATLMASDLWKMVQGMVGELVNLIPVDVLINYGTIVKNWFLNIWVAYEADVIALLKTVQAELLHILEILKVEVPIILNNLITIVKTSEIWKILYGTVMEVINLFPVEYGILVDFFNKIIALPILNIEGVWNLLITDIPVVISNLTTQLLSTDLLSVIVGKLQELRALFPTVEKVVVELWTHVLVPAYNDILAMIAKLSKVNLTNIREILEVLVAELTILVDHITTHLVECETVQALITKIKALIEANPIIGTLYAAVTEVVLNVVMVLKDNILKLWKSLMAIPMIEKLVNYILQIIKKNIWNMEPITWENIIVGLDLLITDVLGVTYTIAANHVTAVVTLPVSVTILRSYWTSLTSHITVLVTDVVTIFTTVIARIPVVVITVKKYAALTIEFIVAEIPIVVGIIKTWVPIIINDLKPTINNLIEVMLNSPIAEFLIAKVDEIIKMYPTEFAAVKAFVEKVISIAIEYTLLVYNKLIEIPIVKMIIDYIWQLINKRDLQSSMVSSVSSVSSIVSSFASTVYNSVPAFTTLHTPEFVSSWAPVLVQ